MSDTKTIQTIEVEVPEDYKIDQIIARNGRTVFPGVKCEYRPLDSQPDEAVAMQTLRDVYALGYQARVNAPYYYKNQLAVGSPEYLKDMAKALTPYAFTHPQPIPANQSERVASQSPAGIEQNSAGCICCANGNDLPDGEYCRACGRENNVVGLARAVMLARGKNLPPTSPIGFSAQPPADTRGAGQLSEKIADAIIDQLTNYSGFADWIGGFDDDSRIKVEVSLLNAINAALSSSQPQSNQPAECERWCPDKCPITGYPFFMWIEHHETGEMVPTYGGPFDSYTIPVRDEDGRYCRERYDHDRGEWLDAIEDTGIILMYDHEKLKIAQQLTAATEERDQLKQTVAEREETIGFLRIGLDNEKKLRALCETDLEERDAELEALRKDAANYEYRARVKIQCERGELWYWQGDGEDYPESLGCPVVMGADVLRKMLDVISTADALQKVMPKREFNLTDYFAKNELLAVRSALSAIASQPQAEG